MNNNLNNQQFRLHNEGAEYDNGLSSVEEGEKAITAHHPETGEEMGYLRWHEGTGEIRSVRVWDQHQKQGIGSAMLHHARGLGYKVEHSTEQTPEGRAWAAKVR